MIITIAKKSEQQYLLSRNKIGIGVSHYICLVTDQSKEKKIMYDVHFDTDPMSIVRQI
jgi:hypothetical protein